MLHLAVLWNAVTAHLHTADWARSHDDVPRSWRTPFRKWSDADRRVLVDALVAVDLLCVLRKLVGENNISTLVTLCVALLDLSILRSVP